MRESIQEWIKTVLKEDEVKGKQILEVGSMDVNGTVRPYLESLKPKGYWGIDMRPGKYVDQVIDCENIAVAFGYASYDIVVCCEMLEHAKHWKNCLWNMEYVLYPGGILVLTTVEPGFPHHDFPEDYHRFTFGILSPYLTELGFTKQTFEYDKEFGIFVKMYKRKEFYVHVDKPANEHVERIRTSSAG